MRAKSGIPKGLTLIELLIALVIVAILATVAVASYDESVHRAKRAQAQVAVLGLAQALERVFTNTNSFAGTVDGNNAPTIYPPAAPPSGTAYYNLTVAISADGASYTITASRVPGGQMASDKSGDYTYTSSGAKGLVNNAAAVADCWK